MQEKSLKTWQKNPVSDTILLESRNSAVGIAAGYELEDQESGV
jgi:hypothetical protein